MCVLCPWCILGFPIVGKSSEEFSCEYFAFVFECDEDGKMVEVQDFKCLPGEIG